MGDYGSWCLLPLAWGALLLTMFFSAANLALRQVAWVKLAEAFSRQRRPERIKFVRNRLGYLIAATSTLRLLVNLGLLLCLLHYFAVDETGAGETGGFWFLKAFVISAGALVVFSHAIPHSWAKYGGTSVLVRAYWLLRILDVIGWPVTAALHLVDTAIGRLAGASPEANNGRLEEKQEELLSVVEEGQKQGVVDEEEREMIVSVLEFRDTTVGEIMTPRTEVVGIEAELDLAGTVEIVIAEGHSRYPVYDGSIDKIVGMLYAKDLLYDLKDPATSAGIGQRLRKPYFVPESKTLRDLLHDFQNQKIHLAVVLDEYGGTAGVVTIEDILEEIVGEIVDEYEPPQTEPLKKIDAHTIEVDARYEIDQLNDEFDLHIPEDEDYETIGGFAFAQLGYIPQTGERFQHENLEFSVIDAGPRKINRLRISIAAEPEGPSE